MGMSNAPTPMWAQKDIAEIEAEVGRKLNPDDMGCLDINEKCRTMTVARDPLLSEIREAENARNRELGSNPELR